MMISNSSFYFVIDRWVSIVGLFFIMVLCICRLCDCMNNWSVNAYGSGVCRYECILHEVHLVSCLTCFMFCTW